MLLKRIITALILIPLVLLADFYLPPAGFSAVTALVFLLAGWEMAGLVGYTLPRERLLYLLFVFITLFVLLLLPALIILIAGLLTWLFMLYCVLRYSRFAAWWPRARVTRTLLSIWLLGACWFSLIFVHLQPWGSYYILFMLLFIWAADTGAYFAGRRWGRRKLAPDISPGKSIEGVIGGTAASLITAILICCYLQFNTTAPFNRLDWLALLVLGVVASLASVLGDLTESMIKRCANAKDSGQLLPGHGGLLDRIDSLLCVAPVVAVGLLLWSVAHII